MTFPPDRIGDKGQRFEVRAEEEGREFVVGWSDSYAGAMRMVDAWLLRGPRVQAWIVDRKAPKSAENRGPADPL
jgi:hypothetical protein